MITLKIDGNEKSVDLHRTQDGWQYFNVIETGPDGLGHPISEHSLPEHFFKEGPGTTITTGGHRYQYVSR